MAERKNYEMNEQELEGIAGGNGGNDDYLYDLGNFIHTRIRLAERRRNPGPRLLQRGRLAFRL